MAYNLLIQDISEGGIKLSDLITRIATTHSYWIKYIWEHPILLMATVFKTSVGHEDARLALECRADMKSRIHHSHTFLKAIVTTWEKFQSKAPSNEEEFSRQVLWDNRYILIRQHPVTWPRWKEANIIHINDLLHDTHPRFLSHLELSQKTGICISFLELV